MRSDSTLRKWFKTYNRKWFNNRLPSNTKILYNAELSDEGVRRRTFGYMEWEPGSIPEIHINPLLKEQGWHSMILLTLLHEMAHIEQAQRRLRGGDHGKGWEGIMLRLAKAGAFSEHNGLHSASLW